MSYKERLKFDKWNYGYLKFDEAGATVIPCELKDIVGIAPIIAESAVGETTVDITIDENGITSPDTMEIYLDAVLQETVAFAGTYQYTGLSAETSYNLTVKILDADGCESLISNTVTSTTDAPSGGVFEDFESTGIGSLPVGWTEPAGFDNEFDVRQNIAGTNNWLQSGFLSIGQTAAIEVTVSFSGPATIDFDYLSSENAGDATIEFFIDGVSQFTDSATTTLTNYSVAVSAGTHTFRWTSLKNAETGGPLDYRSRIDNVNFPLGTIVP